MRYKVGQVLYVILSKKGQVYPMRIIEEITKKTLRGEETNYRVQAGSDASITIMLDQIEGEVYESPEEAKKTLISRATNQIEKIVMTAVTKSKEWYASGESDEVEIHELNHTKNQETYTTVTLADGTVARIKESPV
jgi:hypothetical protein